MALDFPASPNINDTYTFGGVTWTYDGTTWKVLGRFQFTSSETDPVFTASPASNIVNQNITNWNDAYGWGDHSTAGYLSSLGSIGGHTDVTIATLQDAQLLRYSVANARWENWSPNYLTSYTETDPVFTASPAAGINATNISNWNTAYNWGDHGAQGYLTAEADTLDTVLGRGATTTRDITTTGKVYFSNNFANSVDLPNATTYHGMFAHVHAEAHGYFAHAGGWTQLLDTGSSLSELADVATSAPSTNDVLTWDGSNWGPAAPTGGAGGANVTISDTAPGLPSAGDLWWESDTGRLKIRYQDVDSAQWVDASPPLAQPNVPVAAGCINMNANSPTWTGTTGYTVAKSGGDGSAGAGDVFYTLTFPTAYSARTDYIVQASYDGTDWVAANGAQIGIQRNTTDVIFCVRRWNEDPLNLGDIMVTITNL
tara:strand:+ start:2764 stop:4044 length:1281 start_codon:yes stop_codon:yes gene_type:complete